MVASACWFYCCFYCFNILFCFNCRVSDQKERLVSLVIIFSWWHWENLVPFWYKDLSNVRTQIFEEGCNNIQWKGVILWDCINFIEKMGGKLIYWLIEHNVSLYIIILFSSTNWKKSTGILQGIPPSRSLFFGFFDQRDQFATRQAGMWIDFHFCHTPPFLHFFC